MQSRRVIVTLELETAETLSDLRAKEFWTYSLCDEEIYQVQVNVVRERKPATKCMVCGGGLPNCNCQRKPAKRGKKR